MRTLLATLAIIASLAASAHAVDWQFDWDHYQTKQDACLEKDRIQTACSRGYPLALRRAIRTCSAFGPPSEREPSP